jgi:hypothetical protein
MRRLRRFKVGPAEGRARDLLPVGAIYKPRRPHF